MSTRALIVDDDESIRKLISRILMRKDFEVEEAVDGADAIAKTESGEFDVILLDLMMPRVSGFDVIEHFQKEKPALIDRTIVVTAFPLAATDTLGDTCRVIAKPFDLNELMQAIRECAGDGAEMRRLEG